VGGRLDGRFAFVPSPEGLSGLRVVVVKDACSLPGPPETALPSGGSAARKSRGSMTPGMAAALALERWPAVGQAGAVGSGAAVVPQSLPESAAGREAAGGAQSISGMAALVVQEEGSPLECSYPQLLRKLGHAGAAAAIIGSVPGSDVTEIQCRQGNSTASALGTWQMDVSPRMPPQCQHGGVFDTKCRSLITLTTRCCCRHEECDWEVTMPATMIIHEYAQKIATAIHWFEQDAGHDGAQKGVVADFKTEEVTKRSVQKRNYISLTGGQPCALQLACKQSHKRQYMIS
jgi:hypothetical protein